MTGTWQVPGRIDRLKSLHAEGKSASAIAAEIGEISRNAVIGKLHRLGLGGRGRERQSITSSYANRRPRRSRQKAKPAPLPRMPLFAPRPPLEPMPPDHVDDIARVDFAGLEEHHCRWPVGEPKTPGFGYCGGHKHEGSSYCTHHLVRSAARLTGPWVPNTLYVHNRISGETTIAAAVDEFLTPA